MSLPPRVQMLVDQMVQELGFPSGMRPIGLDIDMDDKGLVQRIEPRLRFSAGARVHPGRAFCCNERMRFDDVVNAFFCASCKKRVDAPFKEAQA